MAPLPTIAGCVRVTLPFNPAGAFAPVNVFHFETELDTEEEIGDAFSAGWQAVRASDEPLWAVSSSFIASHLEIIKLDGSSATYEYTLPTVIQGNTAGDMSPASAAVVTLATGQRGPRGRGRKYLGPLAESKIADGQLETASQTQMQDAWDGLLAEWDSPLGNIRMVVASYTHGDMHTVTSTKVQKILGTQRRRQDMLR
jgi:hypothetical protein